MADCSVDAFVTDPPYELGFMGKAWDSSGIAYDATVWTEALRVAKPGAHLLAFGGTRTFHRLTCAIEDAGWEIRDCVMWVYGSGFPKSLDVSKAIDKAAGAEREVVGSWKPTGTARPKSDGSGGYRAKTGGMGSHDDALVGTLPITAPATDAARQWSGWGTALKPAWEPIIVARKPLTGTVAANVQQFGTGAINVDGCRVGTDGGGWNGLGSTHNEAQWRLNNPDGMKRNEGRWPANLIHDGSDEVVGLFPTDSDKSAARFFYCAKASKRDRDMGLSSSTPITPAADMVDRTEGSAGMNSPRAGAGRTSGSRNDHPTVKPIALMRYLCRLVTPPGGLVFDPFAGSGSTLVAAKLEGFQASGAEMRPEAVVIAQARVDGCQSR